jgi:quercetin dioxygenase-like cupin family protein
MEHPDRPVVTPIDNLAAANDGKPTGSHMLFEGPGMHAKVFTSRGPYSAPLHSHTYTEILYVVSGSFRDRGVLIPPGSFVVRQPGEEHDFSADEDTKIFIVNVDGPRAG